MKTKEQVESMLKETEELKARAEAAEARVKEAEQAQMKAASAVTTGFRHDSDEARTMRYFGVSHPKQLLAINTADARWSGVPAECKHLVREFKKSVDVGRFVAQIFHGEGLDKIGASEAQDRVTAIKGILNTAYGRDVLSSRIKAFGSTVSGAGDEWVPTAIASSYIPEYEMEMLLESRFKSVNMPTQPYQLPKSKDVLKARKATEGSGMTAANFGTDKLEFSAVKLAEYHEVPEELNEDSAVDFLAVAREEVVKSHIRAVEAAIISGDSDGTHIDSDIQALGADVAEKIWDGLRKRALANSANGGTVTFANAAVSDTVLGSMRQKMKKFGSNPRELLWIVGPSVYVQLMQLDDVTTVDKFGPQATVLQGALAAYQGIPIYNCQYMREDLNASGVYDGTTTTRASILLVNHTRFMVGVRRPIQVKVQMDLPSQDRYLLAAYQRKAFQGHAQGAGEVSAVLGYNIAL
jgi:HK97 family phage major capsid protein